jgi:hypothetical protein
MSAVTSGRSLAKGALSRGFRALERVGLHVLPRHYYSPVADRRWLLRHPGLWRLRHTLTGVEWDLEAQLQWLERICATYLDEVRGFSFIETLAARGIDFRYGPIEGQVLHCVVRTLAPRLVVEVGGGASTALIADAAARNRGDGRPETRIVTIDPFAPPQLAGLPGVEVVTDPAQAAPEQLFAQLSEGDLLFIDSTHVLRAGSELPRLYLDVLPGLPEGVTIHIHDIYLPYLYSPWILSGPWDWQETVLLAALLTNNPRLEVLCCQSALHDAMPERLKLALPDYRPMQLVDGIASGYSDGHYPSSTWLRSRSP